MYVLLIILSVLVYRAIRSSVLAAISVETSWLFSSFLGILNPLVSFISLVES